ncbi:MAG: FkbM family methyltransferase [Desulfatibacillaceae bacterium]|nr:FkbM family methyltransferase [Desulfatibacillaceae bacterium]
MIKPFLVKLLGPAGYQNSISFVSDVYQSTFLPIKEPGMDIVRLLLHKGGTVLDVGANIGRFTGLAARRVGPTGRVYAFEPLEYPMRVLKTAARLRGWSQVVPVDQGLSSKPGIAQIHIPLQDGWKPKTALAYLAEEATGPTVSETIRLTTLDAFAQENNLNQIHFIKCDVEGSELSFLKGALASLAQWRPFLFMEIDPAFCTRRGYAPDELIGLLASLGYRAFARTGPLALEEIVSVALSAPKDEYFFIAQSKIASLPQTIKIATKGAP